MRSEQNVLHASIVVTLILAGFGILFGILSGSYSVVFDGIYDMNDAIVTALALLVSNLIRMSTGEGTINTKLTERFTMGFWHLEPIVLGLNGIMLIGAGVYALINAIGSILEGGRVISFGYVVVYAVISLIISLGMVFYTKNANKALRSEFIALDTQSWLISSAFSVAWIVAFVFGHYIQGTEYGWISPYIDPLALVAVCIVIIPLPVRIVKKAVEDILLVTPLDLKAQVDEVAEKVVKENGFISYRAYVARVGRGRQVELYFIIPIEFPARKLEEWDRLRDKVEKMLGGEHPDHWLTIVFTTDQEWAD